MKPLQRAGITCATTGAVEYPGVQPHKCPVCRGRGTVMVNFYTGEFSDPCYANVTCPSCVGTGVLWET